jgi:predicted alpha-1,2-mannosidase
MKRTILLFCCVVLFNSAFAQSVSNVQYVDPTIGSVGLILEPTRPTAHLPNSMVRVFPNRKDQMDDQISYFPLTISSHRQPSLFALMPYSGNEGKDVWKRKFTWDQEKATPYYYSVRLEDSGDSIEFTPAAKSGFFKFHFKAGNPHYLRLGVINKEGKIDQTGKRTIVGTETVLGLPAFFYAEVDADIIDVKFADNTQQQALIKVGDHKNQTVTFRYGVSFISVDQAKENLQKEIGSKDFNQVKESAFAAWDKVLGQINVKGGTLAQKRVFYTSLYRSYERMIDINEYGRYYSAYDHKVHESNKPFFVDNWLWDTYIALEPLHSILNPKMQSDKINSYISMYQQSGWMPSFALAFGDNPCMTGNHAATWITDSWMKGIRDFDLKEAYEGLKKNSTEATLLPWRNGAATSLDVFYNKNGYFPALHPDQKENVAEVHSFEKRQSVAVTLENSYSDWCIAQLAGELNKKEDKKLFLERSAFYKNVFRQEKGFMWPKDDKGAWIEPFDPKFSGGMGGRNYTTENNVYTYNWDVKHDLHGLIQLMGGRKQAEANLDNLFQEDLGRSKYVLWNTFPDATGMVGQFVMGNEPSFHIPYVYNYLGSPWKTQKRIRMLMDTWYTDNLFGIPGDEDGGGMTAFVVFSMMGFFPVTPGIPVYSIGSPVFEEISIQLPAGKTFVISAKGNSNKSKYIQSASLNGRDLNQPWFSHDDLVKGGNLKLLMGETPNKTWGSGEENAPPSSINLNVNDGLSAIGKMK